MKINKIKIKIIIYFLLGFDSLFTHPLIQSLCEKTSFKIVVKIIHLTTLLQ